MDNLQPARFVLDRIDTRILNELQQDATIPIAVLADRVGLSTSPCWKRVQKLEKAGVILGRVARVNPAKVGLGLMVLVEVEALDHTPEWRARFLATVEALPEVMEVLRLGGPADYLLRVLVPDTQSFDGFYQRLVSRITLRAVTSKFVMEVAHSKLGLPIAMASE
ncbi:MAG: Lrp/AsnC family transcriptional regulator [Pseudorhodobacter sp.]|nr:Lrp/AsnC family transcriptional regulator [Pseudorhodobacter sp.]